MNQDAPAMARAYMTLVGTVIGAGIFGVPYVYVRAGALSGLLITVLLGGFLILLNLLYAALLLRIGRGAHLPGIATRFLSRRYTILAAISSTVGFWASLVAYLLIGGAFLNLLLGPLTGLPLIFWRLFFYAACSAAVIGGLRLVARVEFWLTSALLIVLVYFIARLTPQINYGFWPATDWRQIVLPYGVILFALAGTGAVPVVFEILRGRGKKIFSTIGWGGLTTTAATALFGLAVVGVSGARTTEQAIDGLVPFLGPGVAALGALLGLLAVSTSFFSNGLYLRDTWRTDFHRSPPVAAALALLPPLFVFFLGAQRFIVVIGFAGALFGAFDSLIICRAWLAASKNSRTADSLNVPQQLVWTLMLVFFAGLLATIWLTRWR